MFRAAEGAVECGEDDGQEEHGVEKAERDHHERELEECSEDVRVREGEKQNAKDSRGGALHDRSA